MTKDANNGNALGDTFVFFPTFRQQLRAIKNKEAELRMRYAIEDYGIDGTLPDFSDIDPLGVMDGMFEQFKYAIDTAKANRMKQSQTNSENGKKGGRPRKEKPTESEKKRKKATESEKSLNVNVNVNVESEDESSLEFNARERKDEVQDDFGGQWDGEFQRLDIEKYQDAVTAFAKENGYSKQVAQRFCEYQLFSLDVSEQDKEHSPLYLPLKDKNGRPVSNWRGMFLNFVSSGYEKYDWAVKNGHMTQEEANRRRRRDEYNKSR